MTSYLADLLSRLKGEDPIQTSQLGCHPRINFITAFNPTLSNDKAEDAHELAKLILFFVDDNLNIEQQSQLSMVGLIRGTCSMLQEFLGHKSAEPQVISLSGSSVVVVDLGDSYYLACSISLPEALGSRKVFVEKQMASVLLESHSLFTILHSLLENVVKTQMSATLCQFYKDLLGNYNAASSNFFGPKSLIWPDPFCYQGVFLAFPAGSYKKSSIRVPDSLRPEMESILKNSQCTPTAAFVSIYDPFVHKKTGLVYSNSSISDSSVPKKDLTQLHNMLLFFAYHNRLDSESLGKRNIFSDFFGNIEQEAENTEEELDSEEVSSVAQLSSAAALQILNPVNLTNSLVVLPLSSTVSGLKYLGQMVNIPWLAEGPPASELPTQPSELHQQPPPEQALSPEPSFFPVGLSHNNISSLLVYLQTNGSETIEYLLVVYKKNDLIIGLLYPSSLQELSKPDFYKNIQNGLCQQISELIDECKQISASGVALSLSMSTLPKPMSTLIEERREVDDDFFYIVYDPTDRSYQSSLPFLPQAVQAEVPGEIAKVSRQYRNAFFHLHDQIADYFVVKETAGIFDPECAVKEHLHKFSINKTNDWLMYFIRHKHKSIVIIRNFNSKHKKSKAPPEEAEAVDSWASSVYEYAQMGFLGSLGDDVKMWLSSFQETQ